MSSNSRKQRLLTFYDLETKEAYTPKYRLKSV